jgi:hypothetical protein
MVIRRFDFEFDKSFFTNYDVMASPENADHPVGMRTGATIHTRKGLNMIVRKRS